MSDMLLIRDLCKSYPSGGQRLEILRNLSLEVLEGEMVAITGVSGSGKSTLLHLVGGMDRPDRGAIRVQGTELTSLDRAALSAFRNRTLGFVFQFHHLLPEFSALENVLMPLLLRGENRRSVEPRGREVLEAVGLAARAHHRPGELSGGEQQRVALARALSGGPRLLLADEPTGNLDPHTGEAVARLFLDLHGSRRLTSILVTHNEKLAQLCSSIYHLEEGRLLRVG